MKSDHLGSLLAAEGAAREIVESLDERIRHIDSESTICPQEAWQNRTGSCVAIARLALQKLSRDSRVAYPWRLALVGVCDPRVQTDSMPHFLAMICAPNFDAGLVVHGYSGIELLPVTHSSDWINTGVLSQLRAFEQQEPTYPGDHIALPSDYGALTPRLVDDFSLLGLEEATTIVK